MLCILENETFGDDDRARAIENREPCQMGNQAAISGAFDVLWIYSVGAVFFVSGAADI